MARKTEAALYPIRAAARLTQLSIETLRAWEKRYKAVEPVRRKGIRLYSDSDIERLSLLRRANPTRPFHRTGVSIIEQGTSLASGRSDDYGKRGGSQRSADRKDSGDD
jgi:DNA-binding transcriptional MerR regulator